MGELQDHLYRLENKVDKFDKSIATLLSNAKIKDVLLTTKETQAYLKKGPKWLDENKHNIGCSKVGGEWRFKMSDIEEYIQSTYHKNN